MVNQETRPGLLFSFWASRPVLFDFVLSGVTVPHQASPMSCASALFTVGHWGSGTMPTGHCACFQVSYLR